MHAWQVAPGAPHDAFDSEPKGSQVPVGPPLQHPFGQVVLSQPQVPVVLLHVPPAQAAQAAPPVPHCEPVSAA